MAQSGSHLSKTRQKRTARHIAQGSNKRHTKSKHVALQNIYPLSQINSTRHQHPTQTTTTKHIVALSQAASNLLRRSNAQSPLLLPTLTRTITMPPIPIHKNAPIKPDGITPSTASTDPNTNPPPTRTVPASVPATTTADSSGPPPPQPGARPVPPTASAQTPYNTSSPAPPQPGATPSTGAYTAHHITTETRQSGPPPQFTQPPPSDSALAGRSTTTSTTASKPGPTTLNLGPVASPFQSADAAGAAPTRTSVDQGRRSLEHPPGYQQAPDNAPYTAGGGIGGHNGGGEGSGDSGEGVGAAAWNMLSKAGEALKKGEEAAWRAVRNK